MSVKLKVEQNTRGRGVIVILAALGAFAPASIAMYLPGLPSIAAEFAASPDDVQATLSVFFVGFALSMLLYGPLADHYGRKPVLTLGILVYVAASLGCAVAASVEQLIVFRLLQALGGGAAIVLSRAVVRDLFPGDEGARVMSLMVPIVAIAPLLAPLLGGWVAVTAGWRMIFVALALYAATCLSAFWIRVPETLPPDRRHSAHPAAIATIYWAVFSHRAALGHVLAGGAAFAGMMAYVGGAPFVYISFFGVEPQHFGYLFGLGVLGIIVGSLVNGRLVTRFGYRRMLGTGVSAAMVCGVTVAVLGLSGAGGLPALVLALVGYVASTGLIGSNAIAGLMGLFPRNSGAAAAVFSATQFGLGALANLAVGILHDGTPQAMCLVVAIAGMVSFSAFHLMVRERTSEPLAKVQ